MKYIKDPHKHKVKNCCGDMKEVKFYDANKKYDFDVKKMDPSVDVMTKTKVDF